MTYNKILFLDRKEEEVKTSQKVAFLWSGFIMGFPATKILDSSEAEGGRCEDASIHVAGPNDRAPWVNFKDKNKERKCKHKFLFLLHFEDQRESFFFSTLCKSHFQFNPNQSLSFSLPCQSRLLSPLRPQKRAQQSAYFLVYHHNILKTASICSHFQCFHLY